MTSSGAVLPWSQEPPHTVRVALGEVTIIEHMSAWRRVANIELT